METCNFVCQDIDSTCGPVCMKIGTARQFKINDDKTVSFYNIVKHTGHEVCIRDMQILTTKHTILKLHCAAKCGTTGLKSLWCGLTRLKPQH